MFDEERHITHATSASRIPSLSGGGGVRLWCWCWCAVRECRAGVLTVTPESNPLPEPLQFAVDHEGCRLLSPSFPALQTLLDTPRAPALLLRLLSQAGEWRPLSLPLPLSPASHLPRWSSLGYMCSSWIYGEPCTDSPRSREISTKVGVDSALRNML